LSLLGQCLTVKPRLALNSQSSFLHLTNAGVTGVHHCTQL
jgi:hypothetical protein